MLVCINSIKVDTKAQETTFECSNLEKALCYDTLYEDVEEDIVTFVFRGTSALKYLYKVCENSKNPKVADAHSMGAKIEALLGSIISLPESFIEKE